MEQDYSHERGFVSYPDVSQDNPGAKAPFVDHGIKPFDPRRYYSREEAELEWERMWMKTWQFAGITHDIPEVGDYFMIDIGRESVIVVRTAEGDDGVKAFFNVCPHRGNRLVHGPFGRVSDKGCFQCDFHGWKFGLDGKNIEIRDELIFRKEQIAHRPGLKEMRCGVWNCLVFICMSQDGISLEEHLNVMPEHMKGYPIEKFRVLGDFEATWDANWKTALDAFVEFYHADDVHPEVLPFAATIETQYDLYAHGLSRMVVPVGLVTNYYEDRDTVNDALKDFLRFWGGNPDDYHNLKGHEWRTAVAAEKRKWARRNGYDFFDNFEDRRVTDDWNYFVFPNITINFYMEALIIQAFRPHPTDPEKSFYRAISLNLPVNNPNDRVMDLASIGQEALSEPGWDGSVRPDIRKPDNLEDFGYVLAQDGRLVPEVQKGMRSSAFKGAILSDAEIRIRHYMAELDRYLAKE